MPLKYYTRWRFSTLSEETNTNLDVKTLSAIPVFILVWHWNDTKLLLCYCKSEVLPSLTATKNERHCIKIQMLLLQTAESCKQCCWTMQL